MTSSTIKLKFNENRQLYWEKDGYIYREGNFIEDKDLVDHMFQDHWDEVQITGLTGDLNINYEYLQYLTEIGCLYSTGVEKDGEAIAYFLVSRNTNMLQRDKATAQAVVLYVNPKYRKSWVSMNLFKFTERYLTIRHNIQYFVMSSGHKNDLTPFLKRLKFRPFEQLYIKTLGD